VVRADYAFPFRIAPGTSRGAQSSYPDHVDEMLRQLLLTSPGERACLPEFGCGLRRLVFAPQSDALVATVELQIRQAVERWLGDQVQLADIVVVSGATSPSSGLDQGELHITLSYLLIEQQTSRRIELRIR
jgi:phage baseplate assembly protein W